MEVLRELPGEYTIEHLARLCGATSKAKVREALRWLEDHGWISIREEEE